ncbi:DUF742 domain-containing protein [Actinokineospora guangxiensis]|uniref:DUF742 domain-containing protein n=1 Tax=Actinokineospora guangxiensis TaxID=1490288 RepID=A0ABW0EW64_9PSEU
MKRPRHASKATYHPQAFGGWGDYQTWADNDFLPKPLEPEDTETDLETDPEPDLEPEPEEPTAASEASAESPDFDAEDPAPASTYADPPTLPDAFGWGEEERAPKARPYVRTGGRTRAAHDLRLETLLSVVALALPPTDPTQRTMRELCRSPISVAEIAARLGVPLGVARILISDAITAHSLLVHEPAIGRDGEPPMDLLHRVVSGLRNLR